MPHEIATLAGGCFWCLEAVYDQLKGVESVESGYMGGTTPDPTYSEICNGDTGHAEVVQVTFDPAQVSFQDLLDVFFVIHDPTTLNRQGNDVGTQYRSAIFYHSPEQKAAADNIESLVKGLEKVAAIGRRLRSHAVGPERRPLLLRPLGRGHRGVDVGSGGQQDLRLHLAGARVEHVGGPG